MPSRVRKAHRNSFLLHPLNIVLFHGVIISKIDIFRVGFCIYNTLPKIMITSYHFKNVN